MGGLRLHGVQMTVDGVKVTLTGALRIGHSDFVGTKRPGKSATSPLAPGAPSFPKPAVGCDPLRLGSG